VKIEKKIALGGPRCFQRSFSERITDIKSDSILYVGVDSQVGCSTDIIVGDRRGPSLAGLPTQAHLDSVLSEVSRRHSRLFIPEIVKWRSSQRDEARHVESSCETKLSFFS